MSSGGNLIYNREEGTFIDNKKMLAMVWPTVVQHSD